VLVLNEDRYPTVPRPITVEVRFAVVIPPPGAF
jgi:hypothetical protein